MWDLWKVCVCEKAHQSVLAAYELTVAFPEPEHYELSRQLKWANALIPAKISGSCVRGTKTEFTCLLDIVICSASEVVSLLFLADDLASIDDAVYAPANRHVVDVKTMLAGRLTQPRAQEN